mgnify:CR=1 FL=1
MAYGKIKVDTVIYDNAGSDVEVAVSGIPSAADVNAKAPLASPALTGTPTAPTAASGTNTTQIATTAFVTAASSGGVSLDTANTWTKGQRGEVTTLTPGTTVTPDFSASNNFSLTLGQNTTIANPTNLVAGQSGSIFLVQGSTGYTGAWGSYWDFAGGTAPTLSAASKVDRVDYIVRSTTSIHAVFTADYS